MENKKRSKSVSGDLLKEVFTRNLDYLIETAQNYKNVCFDGQIAEFVEPVTFDELENLIEEVINFDSFALSQFGIVRNSLNCAALRTNCRSVQNFSPPQ